MNWRAEDNNDPAVRELRPMVMREVMSRPRIPETTLCWRCHHEYQRTAQSCPACRATNGNADPIKAGIECDEQKAADEEWERLNP